jgi:hypothetical protein
VMARLIRGLVLTMSVALTMAAVVQQVPTATDFSACNLEAEVSAAVNPGVTHTEIAPASVSPDRLLEGMRSDGQKDQAYREAYRTCMRGRGF